MDHSAHQVFWYAERASHRLAPEQMGQKRRGWVPIRGCERCCYVVCQMEDGQAASKQARRRLRQEESQAIGPVLVALHIFCRRCPDDFCLFAWRLFNFNYIPLFRHTALRPFLYIEHDITLFLERHLQASTMTIPSPYQGFRICIGNGKTLAKSINHLDSMNKQTDVVITRDARCGAPQQWCYQARPALE